VRENNGSKVVVILNLGKQPQQFTITDDALSGNAQSVFSGATETMGKERKFQMKAWEYLVYKY
jgi:hypothetical protein